MQQSPKVPSSLLSDVYEAIIAAIYLDRGTDAAREFILRTMGDELETAVQGHSVGNHKSALQQLSQQTSTGPADRLLSGNRPRPQQALSNLYGNQDRGFTPASASERRRTTDCGKCHGGTQGENPPYTAQLRN